MPLSEDFTEDLKEAFEIYDKEKAGKLDKDTLGVVLRSLGQNPTEAELTEIFGAVAGVADQKVDVDGMLKAAQMMADKMGSGDHGAALLEAFTIFDKESSGKLASAEIKHLMHNIKFELTEEEMDELMDEIQDSTGSVDYKSLSKLIFEKMDTQPDERKKYKTKMTEIKAYFANKSEVA
mmetsp:Transcript_65319/g.179240  ORF Transcript_65319/g.179240 Transcript_65319/m.179240 type:complete len:179 (-) Transcript_65319:490-1026(-)